MIEGVRILNLRNIVKAVLYAKGCNFGFEMLSLGATNDQKDVRSLQNNIGNGNLVQCDVFAYVVCNFSRDASKKSFMTLPPFPGTLLWILL
jgi:hypothetical protein